jgi:hypothetical protein
MVYIIIIMSISNGKYILNLKTNKSNHIFSFYKNSVLPDKTIQNRYQRKEEYLTFSKM